MSGPRLCGPARALRSGIAGLCLAISIPAANAAESIQALRYGTTLYHFYQQDYFDAITELMVAQQTGELGVHEDDAELLRGGMSLSYGMDLEAQRIFSAYLARPERVQERDRAWFYLAKMAWQRGDLERSAAAIHNVGSLQSRVLQEELNYLRAQLNIRSGNYSAAREYLALLPADSSWLPYHYYNMGAQSAAAGDWMGATQYFASFDHLRIDSEEARLLRDRAYTASGFAHLARGDHERADLDFTRVRLDSPMADRALLGYGWAASERHNYQAALSPWQILGERSPVSPSVRESLLAIPYAFENLGREGVALASYQRAAGIFAAELDAVEAAISLFADSDLPQLLQLEREEGDSWLYGNAILPVNRQAPYLQTLIASHAFQRAIKELRDLHNMNLRLQQSHQRISVLRQVDIDQQQSWTNLVEQEREKALQEHHAALLAKLGELGQRIEDARSGGDGRALADDAQLGRWARVERATALLERPGADPAQKQKLGLLRGLLVWEDSERFHQQRWLLTGQLRELQQLAAQGAENLERLEATIARREHSGFAARISRLQERLAEQRLRVELAVDTSTTEVRRTAVAELQTLAAALALSLGQSRLAIARLYDKGSIGGRP